MLVARIPPGFRAAAPEAADHTDPDEGLGGVRIAVATQQPDVAPQRSQPADPAAVQHVQEGEYRDRQDEHAPVHDDEGQPGSDELDQGAPRVVGHRREQAGGRSHVVAQEPGEAAGAVGADAMDRQANDVVEDPAPQPGLEPLRNPVVELAARRADQGVQEGQRDQHECDRREQALRGHRQPEPGQRLACPALADDGVQGEPGRSRGDETEHARDRGRQERHRDGPSKSGEERPERPEQLHDRSRARSPRPAHPGRFSRQRLPAFAIREIAEPASAGIRLHRPVIAFIANDARRFTGPLTRVQRTRPVGTTMERRSSSRAT